MPTPMVVELLEVVRADGMGGGAEAPETALFVGAEMLEYIGVLYNVLVLEDPLEYIWVLNNVLVLEDPLKYIRELNNVLVLEDPLRVEVDVSS